MSEITDERVELAVASYNIAGPSLASRSQMRAALFSAAVAEREREPVAWLHPTARWAHRDYSNIRAHCFNDGPMPVPLYLDPPPTSELEAEIARLEARLAEAMKALEPFAEAAGEYFAKNFDAENSLASIRRSDGYRYHIKAGHLFAARRVREGGN